MSTPPRAHLIELTSTRFLAALGVFLAHLEQFGVPAWLNSFSGGLGVSFFFVLSGFILCYVYRDSFAGGVAREPYRRFFVARFARVYPCYALALVLLTLVYLVVHPRLPGNLVVSWLANLFALQTFAPSYETQQYWNAPGWSISTEFFFYALCPFILAAIVRHAADRTSLIGLLLVTIAYGVITQTLALMGVLYGGAEPTYWLDLIASRNIVFRIPEFLMGVLAASLLFGGRLPALERPGVRNALLAACIAVVVVLNAAPWPPTGTGLQIVRQYRFNVAYMIPFAGMIVALAAGPTFASPLLRRPGFVFLGEISYAVYIYHWIAWVVLATALNSGVAVDAWWTTTAVLAVVAFSAASYRWFERPMRSWLRGKLLPVK